MGRLKKELVEKERQESRHRPREPALYLYGAFGRRQPRRVHMIFDVARSQRKLTHSASQHSSRHTLRDLIGDDDLCPSHIQELREDAGRRTSDDFSDLGPCDELVDVDAVEEAVRIDPVQQLVRIDAIEGGVAFTSRPIHLLR